MDKSRPYFMKAATDLLLSNTIKRDTGTDQSACLTLVYKFGTVWNKRRWNTFGTDLFNVEASGSHYKLGVKSYSFK